MAMRMVDVAIGIVVRNGEILICRRRPTGHLAGFWEFPGGKLERNESAPECLARELAEEVAITAAVARALPVIEHHYPEVSVRLHAFVCRHETGEPRPLACDEIRWVGPRQLPEYRFPEANAGLINWVIETLSADANRAAPLTSAPPDTAAASPTPEST